jgi:hypothetical protein
VTAGGAPTVQSIAAAGNALGGPTSIVTSARPVLPAESTSVSVRTCGPSESIVAPSRPPLEGGASKAPGRTASRRESHATASARCVSTVSEAIPRRATRGSEAFTPSESGARIVASGSSFRVTLHVVVPSAAGAANPNVSASATNHRATSSVAP